MPGIHDRRAVITGIGVVSPFGVGWSCFAEGLREGRSATGAPRTFDSSGIPSQVVAEVPGFEPALHVRHADRERTPRVVPMAVLAAREALSDAGYDAGELDQEAREQVDVILGSGGGGIEFAEQQYRHYFAGEKRRLTPHAVSASVVGMVASEVSMALRLYGRSHVLSNGCTSSTDALGYSLDLIRSGRSSFVLSGGADACITPAILAGYCLMRAVSTHFNGTPERASRPFDLHRDGFVFGEGAWILALEERQRALDRGAPIYAEVAGYGSTCEAYHRVALHRSAEQPARAIRLSLEDAGIGPASVDYMNLHGTSTQLNDRVETQSMKMALGSRALQVPASATKSMIGHPQGASGAAGVAATVLALSGGYIHPTINLDEPDPECDLDYVPGRGREQDVEFAVCNCLGFGSKSSSLVLRRA